jgi:phosphate transport system substrate-binding protein
VVLLALALPGCGGEKSAQAAGHKGELGAGRLVVTGSSTVAPLLFEMARRFEDLHPGARIDVQTGGSSRGIADARSGAADIGMVSRSLKGEEADLEAHAIARDGIAMIVHRDNSIGELTDEQVVSLFTGRITRWSQVGGADEPVVVVNKAAGRATLEVFLHHFGIEEGTVKADVVIGDNQQGIKTVAGNPFAIGYVSIGTAITEAERGIAIRLLPSGGVAPTLENVGQGRFPVVRTLSLVTRGEPSPLARVFIAFCQSPDQHDLVGAQFFVPIAD